MANWRVHCDDEFNDNYVKKLVCMWTMTFVLMGQHSRWSLHRSLEPTNVASSSGCKILLPQQLDNSAIMVVALVGMPSLRQKIKDKRFDGHISHHVTFNVAAAAQLTGDCFGVPRQRWEMHENRVAVFVRFRIKYRQHQLMNLEPNEYTQYLFWRHPNFSMDVVYDKFHFFEIIEQSRVPDYESAVRCTPERIRSHRSIWFCSQR